MDGASPNLFGSVIAIQVWLRLSPFEVVYRFAQDDGSSDSHLLRLSSRIRAQDDGSSDSHLLRLSIASLRMTLQINL